MNLTVAVLAAGRASRYGENKLLAIHPYTGQPLLMEVIRAYQKAQLTDISILTGYWHDSLCKVLPDAPKMVYVDDWEEGIAASLRKAASLADAHSEGLLIGLGDQVGVSAALITKLCHAFDRQRVITATQVNGVICPPVIFPVHELSVLSRLQGDTGAGKFLMQLARTQSTRLQTVQVSSLTDIDKPEDWLKLD